MGTNLFLKGELRIQPGHEDAVEALRDLIEPDDTDVFDFENGVVTIDIDADVPWGHHAAVHDMLPLFVNQHCVGGVALQLGISETEFYVLGSTTADRLAAYQAYCDQQLRYWTNIRNLPKEQP